MGPDQPAAELAARMQGVYRTCLHHESQIGGDEPELRATGGVTVAELPAAWRSRADELARFAPAAAEAFTTAALDLEQAIRAEGSETVNLREAARIGGYNEDSIGRMIRQGKVKNVGRGNAPRIRRSDIPRKPGGERRAKSPSLSGIGRDAAATRTGR